MSLYYNGTDSFLCAIVAKLFEFKEKLSEIKTHLLCLGNFQK